VLSVLRLLNESHCHLESVDGLGNPETAVKQKEIGVRRPPAYDDVILEEEERPLLEDVSKQRSEARY
jgi:hypothetical protein